MTKEFAEGSPWLELWGNGVLQDDHDCDHVIVRTKLAWSAAKCEYIVERQFLKEWIADTDEAKDAPKASATLAAHQLEPLALFALDAKRDVVDDLRSRTSIWGRLTSDPGLSDDAMEEIEHGLSELNETIVQNSEVLSHVATHLHTVSRILRCDDKGIEISPVARHLRDLNRGMDVRLSTKGASSFPLAKQGMGTRALATMLLFRAYMTWKQKRGAGDALHPFVSLEEPEVHLHPHAQRALFQQIRQIPGQKLVSTHSPYVCSQASVTEFLHFMKGGSETRVTWCDKVDRTTGEKLLDAEDIRRIDREVMNTRGDIVFCRCLVMFEGETEEQAIPIFAASHWDHHPHEYGVSFVGVGGYGKYLAFLRLAKQFDIPWLIFSDGEAGTIKAVNNVLRKLGEQEAAENPRVVVLPKGQDFETYLANAGAEYMAAIKKLFVSRATNEEHRRALVAKWDKATPDTVCKELKFAKTHYGAHVPAAFSAAGLAVPKPIARMLDLALSLSNGGSA